MIKAAIFDLGAVLASDEWPLVHQQLSRELGLSVGRIREVMNPLFYEYCKGGFDNVEFWRRFGESLGVNVPSNYPNSFWQTTYFKWSQDMEEVWQIAGKLKGLGARLAVLSNIAEPFVELNLTNGRVNRLKKIGFEQFFWSNRIGLVKPDPKLFQRVLDSLGVKAEETVFVDDTKAYTDGATALGIVGIHFQSAEQLRGELRKLGLEV